MRGNDPGFRVVVSNVTSTLGKVGPNMQMSQEGVHFLMETRHTAAHAAQIVQEARKISGADVGLRAEFCFGTEVARSARIAACIGPPVCGRVHAPRPPSQRQLGDAQWVQSSRLELFQVSMQAPRRQMSDRSEYYMHFFVVSGVVQRPLETDNLLRAAGCNAARRPPVHRKSCEGGRRRLSLTRLAAWPSGRLTSARGAARTGAVRAPLRGLRHKGPEPSAAATAPEPSFNDEWLAVLLR